MLCYSVPELGLLLRKKPKPGPSDSILQGRYLKSSAYLNGSDRSGSSKQQTPTGLSTIISSRVGGKSGRNRDPDTTAAGFVASGDYYELDEREGWGTEFGRQGHGGVGRQPSLSQPGGDELRVIITRDFRVESSLA